MKIRIIIAATFMLLLPSVANSKDVAMGGQESCGKWVSDHQSNRTRESTSRVSAYGQDAWIAGYLTGVNQTIQQLIPNAPDFINIGADFAGYEAWITRWCKENPLRTINAAASALRNELLERVKPKD